MSKRELGFFAVRLLLILLGVIGGIAAMEAAVQPPFVAGPLRDWVPEPSEVVNARVLAGSTAETVTVPTGTTIPALAQEPGSRVIVAFSASCASFYVRVGGTASVPSGDVTDGTASARNPSRLVFAQGATFSIISPDACIVTMTIGQARN